MDDGGFQKVGELLLAVLHEDDLASVAHGEAGEHSEAAGEATEQPALGGRVTITVPHL